MVDTNQSPNQANGGFAPNAVHHMGRIEQNEIASPNTEQCNKIIRSLHWNGKKKGGLKTL